LHEKNENDERSCPTEGRIAMSLVGDKRAGGFRLPG
jgi:hypothetical protein